MLDQGRCAPHRSNDTSLYKCFTREELVKIAESLNLFSEICGNVPPGLQEPPVNVQEPQVKVCYKVKQISGIKKKSQSELYNSISKRLSKLCKDENCWMNLKFIEEIPDPSFVENLKYFVFKPKMYGDRWRWLSTLDINYILKQYEHFDTSFKFLGAQPCDFLDIISKGEKREILKSIHDPAIKKIGLVLNWDTHDKGGSHWVSIFIDKETVPPHIEYFDSTGDLPSINKWIKRTLTYLNTAVKNSKIVTNKHVHQRGDTECGVYSIYFIIQRILGNDFKSITEKIIGDNDMNLFRDFIFS